MAEEGFQRQNHKVFGRKISHLRVIGSFISLVSSFLCKKVIGENRYTANSRFYCNKKLLLLYFLTIMATSKDRDSSPKLVFSNSVRKFIRIIFYCNSKISASQNVHVLYIVHYSISI